MGPEKVQHLSKEIVINGKSGGNSTEKAAKPGIKSIGPLSGKGKDGRGYELEK